MTQARNPFANIWNYGNNVTLSGGTESCKNHALSLSSLFAQAKNQLLKWALDANNAEIAAKFGTFATVVGALAAALIKLAMNLDDIRNRWNRVSLFTFTLCLSILTGITISIGFRGGPIWGMAILIAAGAGYIKIMDEYVEWLKEIDRALSSFIRRRESLYT